MAFGESIRSDGATVVLAADTQQFNRDIVQAERLWAETTATMSRDALKLDLAQQRLKTSIAKYGAESAQAKRATIALRDAEEQASRSAGKATKGYSDQEKGLGRLTRGALSGSGAFHGLGRSILFASSTFLGGAGFVYAIRTSINAAVEQSKTIANLRNALDASGISWKQYGNEIQDATRHTKELSAFDDEELYGSLQLLIRGTGNVSKALKLNALAADVARGRNISLTTTAVALSKAVNGNEGALRRLVPSIKSGVTATQALEQVQQRYAGAAEAFSDSAAGAQARFNVGIQDLEKAIGRGLLPAFVQLTDVAANWLNDSKNQQRVQEDVAQAVHDASQAAHGFVGALKLIQQITGPVIKGVGGIENAVKLATIAWIAFKLKGVAGFVGTAAASAAARVKMIADAGAVEAAWDTATRPRNFVVTETVTGAGGGTILGPNGKPIGGAGGGGRLGRLGRLGGLGAAGLSILGAVTYGGLEAQPGEKSKDSYYQQRFQTWMKLAREGRLSQGAYAEIAPHLTDAQRQALTKAMGGGGSTSADRLKGGRGGRPASAGPGGGTRRRDQGPARSRTEADIQLDIARASTTAGTADDIQYERELASLYARQVHSLESRKHLSDQQKQKLTALYQSLAGVQSNIDSIVSAGEKKLSDQRTAARAKRRREATARRRRDAAADRIESRSETAVASIERRYGPSLGLAGSMGDRATSRTAAQVRAHINAIQKSASEAGAPSKADIRAMMIDFLQSLTGVIGQFGSNIDEGPAAKQVATHAHVQTQLLRKQNEHLKQLELGQWHPATSTARGALSVSGIGPGF